MVKSMVKFGYADSKLLLKNKRAVQTFVSDLIMQEVGLPCILQYVFCSDDFLLQINQSYLKHNDFTDIITFDLSVDSSMLIEGEIYISTDRVLENAAELDIQFEMEMLRVIFHGALHLCGFRDKTKGEKSTMRHKEDYYLHLYASRVSRGTS